MKSTYDVVAIVVVRRFEADNKCWPSLKKMALQTDLSNLRLHPAPHHAIEIEQPARSDMGRKNVARAVTICEFGEIVMSLARCACSRRPHRSRLGIFRPMNELVERNLVPLVHRLLADHAFRNIAVSLGKPRMRHRIHCSAMRTKEGPTLGYWAC